MKYGKSVTTPLDYDGAIEAARSALRNEGFGVLCEIDVGRTLQEKIGAELRPYRILGACNPELAHRALQAEPQLGLLLPCNVVIQRLDGATVVSAIDARALLGVVGNDALMPVADDVNARLGRVLESVAAATSSSTDDLRKEIEDADDTGMVAGEELITQAETLLPLLRAQAAVPRDELHAALPQDHAAHAMIEKLHAAVEAPLPNPRAINEHVGALRALPELEAIVANWWENPKTQRYFSILAQIGV